LVIAAHEFLKAQIVELVRDFFTWPNVSGDMVTDERYRGDVLSLVPNSTSKQAVSGSSG
jgi:hypothetical protein